MADKDLKNQLEDLFSGLTEPPSLIVEENRRPERDRATVRPGQQEQLSDISGAKNDGIRLRDTAFPHPLIPPDPSTTVGPAYRGRPGVNWRLIIWSVLGTLAVIMLVAYGQAFFSFSPARQLADDKPRFAIPLSPTPTTTPILADAPTAQAIPFSFLEPTATLTPVPEGRVMVLTPAAGDAGWVAGDDAGNALPNHFGDSFLYAGILNGKVHHAAIQFDLAQIPRGTKIYAASLRLTGLRADQLGQGGQWRLRLLASEIDYHWRSHNYQQIHHAATWATIEPSLTPAQLGAGRINQFEFAPEQLALLERRLLEGSDQFGKLISFRLDGPVEGGDNLFAWDSGYGPASQGAMPELFLSLGPPPLETPPPYYVVITSTPTPEDVMTAAANSLRMTAEATRVGTATPLPPNWVTPVVVTATPTAENQATARAMQLLATSIALTTGEPPNLTVVTATPTPNYIIITSTPTPEDILTAVANSRRLTAEAVQYGTATPFPPNWVTPLVVTSTPAPANNATVEYRRASILTTGTPTPMPGNVQTATPTPVAYAVEPLPSPTATATPSPTPQSIPASLLGKIVFVSDREGATEEERLRADKLKVTPQVTPQPYVFDPATGQLQRLTAMWPYEVAIARDGWSADSHYQAYTRQLLWTNINGTPTEELAIHYYDYLYNVEHIVTRMGAGIVYDPAWSPVSDEIAFVATESRNDEVWVIKRDGTEVRQLTRNEWEWDKHPSWSPDGQQIVFYSNRTGNNQLWIMNKDGSEQRLLMEWNPFNDTDPVWIKYLDPPPPLERKPDWRFIKPPEESR